MIRITTPATSANLAVGFDSIGLALQLYNVFLFQTASSSSILGFSDDDVDTNLVYKAYCAFLKHHQRRRDITPVTITLEHQGIPISRGLGSSASCIIAGVIASNEIHQLGQSIEDCAAFAAEFEGHPDNIYACMYGGLTAVFKDEDAYVHDTYPVLPFLHLTLLIPEATGNTNMLRQAIPESVLLEDAVFHLSRMIHLPRAFETADMVLLKQLLQDRIHEQYRYPSIPNVEQVINLRDTIDGILVISGSGPSLLVLSSHDISDQLAPLLDTFTLVKVDVSGPTLMEVLS